MSEYTELTAKIEALEKRVKYLEDTFATLAAMNKSGEMGQYIAQRQRALAASKLVNAAAGTQKLNADAQQQVIDQLAAEKAAMDARIEEAIRASAKNTPAEDDLAEQFTYQNVPGGVEIEGFNGFEVGEELVIPQKIKGKTVVGIGKEAFKNMKFKKVIMPQNVINIGNSAFEQCKELTDVILPEMLSCLRDSCFASTGLTKIVMPTKLKKIGANCFGGCRDLKVVILNSELKEIGIGAFSLTNVSNIIIPESVESIWDSFNWGTSIAVLGMKTKFGMFGPSQVSIYCLAGSEIQKDARRNGVTVEPLSEFKSN